jgi:hypothetical protein
VKAWQHVKLTSTNRPFGLSIELTPRSKSGHDSYKPCTNQSISFLERVSIS